MAARPVAPPPHGLPAPTLPGGAAGVGGPAPVDPAVPWPAHPPLGPGAHLAGLCSDRLMGWHGAVWGVPNAVPGPPAQPCSKHQPSNQNPAPGFGAPGQSYGRAICPRAAGGLHLAGHSICRYCLEHIAAQPWYQRVVDDVTTEPPPLPVPAAQIVPQPLATWTQFWTYLCHKCELVEVTRLQDRRRNMMIGAARPPNWQEMIRWPVMTCLCMFRINDLYYCMMHRHASATVAHNINLQRRLDNDHWLRETAIRGGRLTQAHHKTKESRRNRGVYRACRCGAEIKPRPNWQPSVYMCMGCEGIIHTNPPPNPVAGPVPAPPPAAGPVQPPGVPAAAPPVGIPPPAIAALGLPPPVAPPPTPNTRQHANLNVALRRAWN